MPNNLAYRMLVSAAFLSLSAMTAHAQAVFDTRGDDQDYAGAALPTPQLQYAQQQMRPAVRPQQMQPPPEQYQALSAQPQPRPRYVTARQSGLGGGFIEFLFNGMSDAPNPRVDSSMPQMAAPPVEALQHQAYAPATPATRGMDPKFLPQTVAYEGTERPGTIIVNTEERFLYLVEDGGIAKRYGIGVGRPGFSWAGEHKVTAKREWPDWYPPEDMLKRRPDLPHFMPGGPQNPLGARALYLGSTLYRIHGSNEPWTIGHAVSSGCIRMRNEDVVDLYGRVAVGTKVVVI
jgi:lipoprotein-anchoring transpeptidase ErfK/SrfK